jgi:uncharacterized protein YjiS (DUF1127 family)
MRPFHSMVGGLNSLTFDFRQWRLLRAAFANWRARRRRARISAELNLLNDHLLRDIGLSRTDVLAAMTKRPRRSNW